MPSASPGRLPKASLIAACRLGSAVMGTPPFRMSRPAPRYACGRSRQSGTHGVSPSDQIPLGRLFSRANGKPSASTFALSTVAATASDNASSATSL